MKQLRILTGNHAGAQVRIVPGSHRVGSNEDADIRITDWIGNDVLLSVNEEGVTGARRVETTIQPRLNVDEESDLRLVEPGLVLLIDFVPMPFDDIVLCVGAEDTSWPSDLALLSTLLTRDGVSSVAERKRFVASKLLAIGSRRMLALGACVLVGALGLGGLLSLVTGDAHANQPSADFVIARRANRAFADAGFSELRATPNGHDSTTITGMVRSRREDFLVRQILDRVAPNAATREYGIADDTVRSINDALGIEGTQVAYSGHGVFVITGIVASSQSVKNALARVRGDLDKSVRDVQINVTEHNGNTHPEPNLSQVGIYSALVSSSNVEYSETPDGVKHIYSSNDLDDSDSDDAISASDASPQTTLAIQRK